jgi:hypothetical protein
VTSSAKEKKNGNMIMKTQIYTSGSCRCTKYDAVEN